MSNPTISQVTKCVKRNKQNIQIQLNEIEQFTQSAEFVIYREKNCRTKRRYKNYFK